MALLKKATRSVRNPIISRSFQQLKVSTPKISLKAD
jgi:hypothetical protein